MSHIRVYWLTCVSMLLAISAAATTIVMPTDEQLIEKSPVIVEATVRSTQPVRRGDSIWTETHLVVTTSLKGSISGELIIREIGGELDGHVTKIFGGPEYVTGQNVLAFLAPTPRGDYQTVDLFVGKFTEKQAMNGERFWARDGDAAQVTILDASFQPLEPSTVQRSADAFSRYVADRVAGHEGQKNYGIENPVPALGSGLTADFTLISEPTVYRWGSFDNGTTARWYSYGSQSGYSNGGVSEVQTAMASWTGYSAALIKYSYVGTTTTHGGNVTGNGVNEVLFEDPNQEIAGSWNPRTGGTVGLGGFNGVSGSSNWTAPFAADSTHTAGTFRAVNITEGNFVVQDGVSAANGIPSAMLAEIAAHEFGHTLGFGHSSDSYALMYPSVSGSGPSLRADDQLAARWLYPSGTSTPPPAPSVPAAPTNLSASPGSTSVALSWTDNATNETGQSIYVAQGTGAFSKAADIGANLVATTLTGFTAGTYRFYIVATNSAGTSAQSNIAQATLGGNISAAFTYAPANPVAGQSIAFTDKTSGGATSWKWTFGDGTSSTLQNPTKSFAQAGTYHVVLTASKISTSSAFAADIVVNLSIPTIPPVGAAFAFSPSPGNVGEGVSFFDQSSGSPTSWSWSFGDGTTSSLQNPTHVFAARGAYLVTLTASNTGSSGSATRQITINGATTVRSLVSVTAQTNGVGGSVWRTELTLFNAGTETVSVQAIFLPGAGGSLQTRSFSLAPWQLATYSNALLEMFGLASGAGAIAIEANGVNTTPQLKIASRTFTNGATGTYGQAVPDVDGDDLQQTLFVTGLASSSNYRTNVGLVNRSGGAVAASLALVDPDGRTIGQANVTVAANSFQQGSLASFFPTIGGASYEALSMRVTAGAQDALSAYASVIDNRTQDPVYGQAAPAAGGGESVIPAVGRVPGANGTFWRSDVTLFNPSTSFMQLELRYLPSGADNRAAGARSISIAPNRTLVLADVLSWLGQSSGSGALDIRWSSTSGPVVTSRTYTSTVDGGTYGQSIDAAPMASFRADVYVTGLRADAGYRSNIGLVNGSDAAVGATVVLIANGRQLASAFVQIAPRGQMQYSLPALFPNVNASSIGSFTIEAHTDAPSLLAYGSIVDNASGDPVFFAGE